MMKKNPIQVHQRLRQQPAGAVTNPYLSLYGLRENPFPTLMLFSAGTDDPRQNGEIYDEQFRIDEEKRFFKLFVQPPTGDEPLRIGFVRLDPQAGARGNGKSAFLHHLMVRVNEQRWDGWPIADDAPELFALALHVLPEPKKQKNFYELARLIFETLARGMAAGKESLLSKIDADLRAALLVRLLSEDQIDALATFPPEQMQAHLAQRDAFVKLLKTYGHTWSAFADIAREALEAEGGTSLNGELADLLTDSQWEIGRLWPQLADRSGYAWQKSGPEWVVNGLMPVLMVAGYQRFYLLLDEFERIYVEQTSKKRDEFLYSFRHYFYEGPTAAVQRKYVSSLLTLHPSIDKYLVANWQRVGLEQMAPLTPPRMEHNSIPLGASTVPKLTGLVITYLDYFRDGSEHRGTVYPFASGALNLAIEAAQRYPRDTLWYAHMILRKAAEEAVPAPIPPAFVEAFLGQGVRPPKDAEDQIYELAPSATDLQGE